MANFHVTGDKGKTLLVEKMEERNPSGSVSHTDMDLNRLVELFQGSKLGSTVKAPQIPEAGMGDKRVVVEADFKGGVVEAVIQDSCTDEIGVHLASSNQSPRSPSIPGAKMVLLELPQPEIPCSQLPTESAEKTNSSCAAMIKGIDSNSDATRPGGSEAPAPLIFGAHSTDDSNSDATRPGRSEAPAPLIFGAHSTDGDATGGLGVLPHETEAGPVKTRKSKTAKKMKQSADNSDSVVRTTAMRTKKRKQLPESNDSMVSKTAMEDGGTTLRTTKAGLVPKPALEKIDKTKPSSNSESSG